MRPLNLSITVPSQHTHRTPATMCMESFESHMSDIDDPMQIDNDGPLDLTLHTESATPVRSKMHGQDIWQQEQAQLPPQQPPKSQQPQPLPQWPQKPQKRQQKQQPQSQYPAMSKQDWPLSGIAIKQIDRLLGTNVQAKKYPQRNYHENKYPIPEPIQFFCDLPWPKNTTISSTQFRLQNQEMFIELAFESDDLVDFDWLQKNPDHLILSLGEQDEYPIIACKMQDKKQNMKNFYVYIIHGKDGKQGEVVEGPFTLAKFLEAIEFVAA